MNRREFLLGSLAAGAALGQQPVAKADSVIFIWLPGGVAHTDTWDPKKHTPYKQGMKGNGGVARGSLVRNQHVSW